ncbi:hypothetical protein LPJ56_000424 [Coemansia sp. RSA 2599]|nr:hypothetical protein LPJ75_000080 [Coemansia sp. RSA 2598]KAJ1829325.1 hypothetical protein LPJ56_000424 [Coemansia sp. RSA 2599]
MNNEDGQNNAKAIVDSRLRYRTVAQIIDSALEKDRRTRRFVKALEYGSYMALAALVAKWTWIGNSVFMAGFPLLPKTLASIAALLAAAAGVRFALRHSIMGSLTTPLLSDLQGGSHSTAASEQLSVESDADALRRLRQAFPASPSDETMAEINEMISATHSADGSAIGGPRLSWKLRLALMWSRFARRFAVVEPALVSQHELCQFLAVSWLREIVRMFAPEKRTVTDATRQVSSKAIEEFVEFLQTRFTDIPLVLGHDDIAAISRFVTVEADAATVDMFLDLATRGYLALSRGQQGAERRHHALAAASGGSFGKQQAAAAILAYCGCIQSATQMGPETSEQLYASLQKLIASTLMPISRSLCQIAFQGAAALNSLDKRQSTMGALVKSLETRYKQKDPYLLHLLSGSGQTTSESPRTVPIVRCISDYIAALARRPDANYVCAFVQRWIQMGILSPAAAEQCLLAATNAALSLSDRSRISAENSRNYVRLEQLADLACKIASGSVSSSENSRTALASVALPMYALLTKILGEFSRSIEPEDSRISAENVLDALSRTVLDPPALRNFAPQDFNEAAIRLLLTLVSRQRETKSKVELISRAIRYLDLMRHLNQTPAQRTLEQLCAMAESLKMDVSAINSYWNDIIKQSDKNKKVSLFAKSLL